MHTIVWIFDKTIMYKLVKVLMSLLCFLKKIVKGIYYFRV
jgi:hypothetical protein